jgi:hypothetical protein
LTVTAACPSSLRFRHWSQREKPFHVDHLDIFTQQKVRDVLDFSEGADGEFYIFLTEEDKRRGVRPKGILDKRGRVLQEQLLSPRILYYGEQEIYWDCITPSASERSPIFASLLDDGNPDEMWAFRLLRRTVVGYGDVKVLRERLAGVWIHVVQNYSARSFTQSFDKLIALRGIIRAPEDVLEDESVAAMWQSDLWKEMT